MYQSKRPITFIEICPLLPSLETSPHIQETALLIYLSLFQPVSKIYPIIPMIPWEPHHLLSSLHRRRLLTWTQFLMVSKSWLPCLVLRVCVCIVRRAHFVSGLSCPPQSLPPIGSTRTFTSTATSADCRPRVSVAAMHFDLLVEREKKISIFLTALMSR